MIEINKIYNENCLDTMKQIPNKFVDLLLTDPPYGVGMEYDNYEDTKENWYVLMDQFIPEAKRISKMVIMPSCQINFLEWIYVNHPPDWLICWYKGSVGHNSFIGFNDWEPHLVYGKVRKQMTMHDFFQTKSSPKKGTWGHPCPKPYQWSKWLILRSTKKNDIIYDPFMGSGTVVKMAKGLGRNYIGSELSKKYYNKTHDDLFFTNISDDINNLNIFK